MKIVTAFIAIVVIGTLFFFLYKPRLKINFQATNVASDTTFKNPIWHTDDGYGRHISLRAIGKLDPPTEVFITDAKHDEKFLHIELPKGRFDTTWKGEYYERKADLVFLHKGAKSGSLKLVFRYLTPNGDTLSQGSTD